MPGLTIWLILLFGQAAADPYQQAVGKFQAGRFEDALRSLEQLPHAEKARAPAQNLRSLALMKLERFKAALEANGAARALEPANPNYLYNTGLIHISAGDVAGAERVLREGASRFPDSVRLLQAWAEALQRVGNLREAESVLRKAAGVEPRNAGTQAALAKLYYAIGDRKQFAAAAQRAIALDGNHYLACFLYGKYLLEEAGQETQGRQYMARSIQLAPAFEDGLIEWAAILSRENRWQEAAELYQRAANANPSRAQTYYLLHHAYRKMGKTAEAAAALQRFQTLNAPEARL